MSLKTHPHLHQLLGKPCADVFTFLRRVGQATAAELAQELGITPNGVRRHLKRLEAAGLVAHVVERRREPGAEAAGLATTYAALLQRLENAGYILSETDPGHEFCLQNCPARTFLRSFPQLCEAKRTYFERFLGAPVRRTFYGARENICSFRVEAAVQ